MSKKYKQLSIMEREIIQTGLLEKKSIRAIACELGRSPSTLSRELKRNGWKDYKNGQRYSPSKAHSTAHNRIITRGKRPRLKNAFIQSYVHKKLPLGWSPEQIAGRLSEDHPSHHISYEAIYQYIYAQYRRGGYGNCTGADLRKYLRRRHKVRRPKKLKYAVERGPLQNRVSIDQRPAVVDKGTQPGHWEGDSMLSRQSKIRLNTLVERTSGLVQISKLKDGSGGETTRAVIRRLQRIPRRLRRTLTLDNGIENAGHEQVADVLGTNCKVPLT